MTDHVYTPNLRKPYFDPIPLFELSAYDTLRINYAGHYWFRSQNAPFFTLSGNNYVEVNAFLSSLDSGFNTGGLWASSNQIVINAAIESNYSNVLNGDFNTLTNNGDLISFYGHALVMNGDNFNVFNSRLINSETGVGLDITGNHGRISSYGEEGLKGLILGAEVGIRLNGSFNEIDFGKTGRIITDGISVDGTPDTDGAGDGLLLEGNDNNVRLYEVIAGDNGVRVSGDNNAVTLGFYEAAPVSGAQELFGKLTAWNGIELAGKNNSLVSYGNIEVHSKAIDVWGSGYKILTMGDISAEGLAIGLYGDGGNFRSHLGTITSRTNQAFDIWGDSNSVYIHRIGSAGIGFFAVENFGNCNTISIEYIDKSSGGVFIAGEHNTLYFERSIKTAGVAALVQGNCNTIATTSYGAVAAQFGFQLEGTSNTLTNIGSVDVFDTAVLMTGDLSAINNNGLLSGFQAGVSITGKDAKIENRGVIMGGKTGVSISGDNAKFFNYSSVNSSGTAVSMKGYNAMFNNAGTLQGGVAFSGDSAEFFNNGDITSTEKALSIIGNHGYAKSIGALKALKTAVHFVGNNNTFESIFGTIRSESESTIAVKGNYNEVVLSAFTDVIGSFSATSPAITLEGLENRLVSNGRIVATGTAVSMKGMGAKLENGGVIRGATGLVFEGGSAIFKGLAGSSIHGDVTAVKIKGTGELNTFDLQGSISSHTDDAVVVEGVNNQVNVGSVISDQGRALYVNGNNNTIEASGNVDSLATTAVYMSGDDNKVTLNASTAGTRSAVEATGSHIHIVNNGYMTVAQSDVGLAVISIKSDDAYLRLVNSGEIDAGTDQYAILQTGVSEENLEETSNNYVNFGIIKGSVKLGDDDDSFNNRGEMISTRSGSSYILYDVDLGGGSDLYKEADSTVSNGIKVFGGTGKDALYGEASNNVFFGGADDDTLSGGGGNDFLSGGAGIDDLEGGEGADIFSFGSEIFELGIHADIIKDFEQGEDRILLSAAHFDIFTDASGNPLETHIFNGVGGFAETTDHRLLYDTSTFMLYYDADGIGKAHDRILIAELTPSLPWLQASDILVL